MTGQSLSIEMLPARHGDALWVEWGSDADRHRIVIDGGPSAAYDMLRDRFLALDPDERRVDLLVVTHIDLDHIEGVIRLLRDESLGIEYGDVWFNDFRHLAEDSSERGALQGEFLAAVIEQRELPWNRAFGGNAVKVPTSGSLPSVQFAGGLRLVVLSPTSETLLDLREAWTETLAEAEMEPGDRAAALALLEERMGPAERGGRTTFGGDRSAANGSSIALIAELGDERWLLAGDAHDDVLLAGLERYALEHGETTVRLDGFKLAHHGSMRNITPELMAAIDCDRFLVSTNGAYFRHPDEACIDLIVAQADHPELVFNYRTDFTSKWSAPSPAYRAVYLDDPAASGADGGDALDEPDASAPDTGASGKNVADGSEKAGDAPIGASADTGPGEHPHGSAAGAATAATPLRVEVVHGSLELADHPVLVGHYVATPLSGSEYFVDRRFKGRLSERLALGEYPGEVGTSLLVHPPSRRQPADGVMIVGLGEFGELTPLRLVETVRGALVRRALDELDARPADDAGAVVRLGISSVLLGATGEQGLSVASSVRAIVMAAREANRSLGDGAGSRQARYDVVQFWEQYESHAELAFRAVLDVAREASAGRTGADRPIVPADDLRYAAGALENSPVVDAAVRVWRRVRICVADEPEQGSAQTPSPYLELDVTVGGRSARTGRLDHRVERRRLERLLGGVVGDTSPDAAVHSTLFELLLPNELKWDLMAAQDIQLEVDDVTADIPWEMLAARNPEQGTREQLALRAPIVRQLRLADVPTVLRSSRPNALVIGNPPAGQRFPSLPGAYGEARTVQGVLERPEFSYSVTSLCFADDHAVADATTQIETALFADDYRIIHIAGHGLFQPDDPTRTGVVIGPDDFLTARMLAQLDVVPDLVFLNCCHLAGIAMGIDSGAIDFTRRHLHRLGASLARQLIDSGVRAVVVAGWAVDDAAALSFARTFYERMLMGSTFGDAVFAARRAAWTTSPAHSTWGAYQCYGDGGYRLPRDAGRRSSTRPIPPPLTPMEAVRRIELLVRRVESIGIEGDGDQRTREELDLIEGTTRDRGWVDVAGPDNPDLAQRLREALADAWGALGDHARAVEWYRLGLAAEKTTMSLRALEQLANHQDRLARRITRVGTATDADRARASELLASSIRLIELLEQLSGSGERAALRAGHHKRRAAATSGAERAEALRGATGAYLVAYRQHPEPYGLLNYIQLEEIRCRVDGDESAARSYDEALDAALEAGDRSAGDYWNVVAAADAHLTRAIVDDAVDQRVSELVQRYSEAFDTRSTALQRASTLDHLSDLADLHPDLDQAAALASIHDQLAAVING